MTNFSPFSTGVRARRPWLAGLLLALLPLLSHAATPVLRLEATVVTSDVTAFVDQVEIIDATTGLPVRGAVTNAGFETTGSLGAGSFGYVPTGTGWSFVNSSGIATNGSAFNNPTAPEGTHVGLLQSSNPGAAISQTLPNLVPGLYRVRLRVAQRNTSPANQGVRVRVDGVDLGTVVPGGTFAMYQTATFVVARPTTSGIFPAGSLTTPGGTPPNVTSDAASTVTDVDGDGLLDLLVGNTSGNVQRFEQTVANSSVFAAVGNLTTNGSTVLNTGGYAVPTVTDLDDDGLLDLLVGNPAGTVLHYEQTVANGSVFAPATDLTTNGSTLVDAGDYACQDVTDLDGDGLLDLLVGNRAGNVQRFEQASLNGTIFNPMGNLTTTSGPDLNVGSDAIVKVTDVDGDGLLDLMMGNNPGNVTRYEQSTTNGSVFALVGTLTTNGSTLLNVGNYAFAPATDVDGDGLLDLLVGNHNGIVQRFEQAAPPTALALAPQAVAENAASGTVVGTFSTTDPTPGDTFTYTLVTGTGSTDNASFAIGTGANAGKLVTAAVFDFETKSSYLVRVRTTDATGAFIEQAFTITITDVAEPPVLTSFSPASGALGSTITITGQNLTGLTSVLLGEVPALFAVVSNTSVTLTVPRQATSQKLRISRTGAGATNQGTAVSATAFSVTRPGTSIVFPGGAALTTDGSTAIAVGVEATPTVTDLDGDGLLDLLVGNNTGNVLRYEQTTANGSSFAGGAALTTNGTTALDAVDYVKPVVTDLDGDGLLDLLVSNGDGNVLRYEQTAANGLIFAGGVALTTDGSTALNAGYYPASTVTDVDGDGLLDLLVGASNGNMLRYEQTAANGLIFAGGAALTTDGSTALNVGVYAAPTVTDVDSDGLLDLLVGNYDGNVLRYEQTTAGGLIFAGGTALTTNGSTAFDVGSYATPTVTDVDGDGLLDLLVGNSNNGAQVLRYEQAAPPTALALTPQAVAENAASGTVVGTFATTDATPGDTFTYTLVAGTGSTDNASFAIGSGANAGKLVTAAVFDFETKASYSIRVRVTDATGYPFEQVFTISITDVAEVPVLTSFSPASGPLGTTITITGQYLTGLTSVLLGEVPALFTVVSSTSVTVTVPRQATSQKLRISRTSGPATSQGTVVSATAFVVTRPSASSIFPVAALTTDGSTSLDVGQFSAPAVTDIDGNGRLDLLVGSISGTVTRYEQTTANGSIFALVGDLTTNGSTALDVGGYSARR